ncbi:LOW QUALITY PROTEIN: hypothetical protein HID58_093552, partial [Brassica napus]
GGFIKHALYGEVARKHAPSCCILGACFILVCGKEGCIKHALYGEVARKHVPSCDTLSGIHVSYVGCSNPTRVFYKGQNGSPRYESTLWKSVFKKSGHSQSPLPASSYSNEQPRRRGNQEAEIPLGILVDLVAVGNYGNLTDLVERAVNVEVAVGAEAKYESKRKGVSGPKGKHITFCAFARELVERCGRLLESMLRHVVSLVVLHFAARKVARVCPYVAGQRGCIKHALYGEVARKPALSFDTLSGLHVSYVGCSNPCAFVAAS